MTFTFAIGDQLNQLPNEMPNDVKTILHDVETVVETQEVTIFNAEQSHEITAVDAIFIMINQGKLTNKGVAYKPLLYLEFRSHG